MPKREDSLSRGIGEAHRLYTRAKNFRARVRGYLFQGRFGSCVLDEKHLLAAARYVDLGLSGDTILILNVHRVSSVDRRRG